jgi:hypothetical protein
MGAAVRGIRPGVGLRKNGENDGGKKERKMEGKERKRGERREKGRDGGEERGRRGDKRRERKGQLFTTFAKLNKVEFNTQCRHECHTRKDDGPTSRRILSTTAGCNYTLQRMELNIKKCLISGPESCPAQSA